MMVTDPLQQLIETTETEYPCLERGKIVYPNSFKYPLNYAIICK